jgi:YaiO family outer membrane protein
MIPPLILPLVVALCLHGHVLGDSVAAGRGFALQPTSLDVQIGGSYEALNKGFADWRSFYAQVTKRFAPRKLLYGRFTETRRFSREDQTFLAGTYYPLSERWSMLLEAAASPSHRVVPKWSALVQFERSFPKGWGAQIGLRHSEYNDASPSLGILGVEKYWKVYRAAYVLNVFHLEEDEFSTIHRVQADYYYGDSNVGIVFAAGRELETLLATGITGSDVVYLYLVGRHWLNSAWAVNHSIGFNRHGDLYTASGITLDLLYRF